MNNLQTTPTFSDYGTGATSTKLITIINQRFAKIAIDISSIIETKLRESEERIIKRMESLDGKIAAVSERVSRLEQCMPDINVFNDDIAKLKLYIEKQENSLVANELRIQGIPKYENEQLHAIFETICKSTNIHMPTVTSIRRLNSFRLRDNKIDPVICVKLSAPFEKNAFLKSLADFRRKSNDVLRLTNAGFNSDQPFYINEALTKLNHDILKEAVSLKKKQQLWSVFTRRGRIYVKRNKTDTAICMENKEMFKTLTSQRAEIDVSMENGFRQNF